MSLDIKRILVGAVIALSPATTWAMLESEEEDKTPASIASRAILISSKEDETPYSVSLTLEEIPDEVMVHLFSFLDVLDLGRASQVSKQWHRAASEPILWRGLGLRKYGEYLTEEDLKENPKENVVFHFLSVCANALTDLDEIDRLVRCYRLVDYKPSFKTAAPLMYRNRSDVDIYKINDLKEEDQEELIAQGNKSAIESKIHMLLKKGTWFKPVDRTDLQTIRELNELLVEQGDTEAIERKFEACRYPAPVRDLVLLNSKTEGNKIAWRGRRARAHFNHPTYGYDLDREEGAKFAKDIKELNELLIQKGDNEAIERKIRALWQGGDEYIYHGACYFGFDVYTGHSYRGAYELTKVHHTFGYEKNPKAAMEFNDTLIERGDRKAIERKAEGLYLGEFGYEKKPEAAREFIESLVIKGDQIGLKLKLKGVLEGRYGYQKASEAAREIKGNLIEGEDIGAIETTKLTQSFIENDLILSGYPLTRGIGRYLKVLGLKYGVFGYEKDRTQAIEYIKKYNVPF